ncbi:MAG: putative signal transducing protein [Odoribacter splanchnicus]|uniref:putative signal transducing protein n=1 Tax=Odoribacter laneus TaxID=626933 RepID=UPI00033D3A72|nr:DUF2007 domain-containing protein [Odoribacter laneus]MBS1446394.1 DUF2007 domain-containing protein [Odoribacter sp.]CCZ80776.1 putative uncharacterized protein [Odoribacter laneus CAG:561]
MDNWTSVFETDQLYKAELVKDILCNNDIDAVILNQKDSSYNTFGEIYVMVSEEEKGKAEEIIKNSSL